MVAHPRIEEATKVVQAYVRALQLNSCDSQMHFDHGNAFMGLRVGLGFQAIEAFEVVVRLQPSWSAPT
jgi:RsiW-degrading membrane proteinase PrsW (M82 family)